MSILRFSFYIILKGTVSILCFSFYIILKGTVSIYISQNISDMDEEEEAGKGEGEQLDDSEEGGFTNATLGAGQGQLDRTKFGNYIAILGMLIACI